MSDWILIVLIVSITAFCVLCDVCRRSITKKGPKKTVHLMFGLSRASYFVLPRSLMEGMSQEWQERFVALVEEMEHIYDLPSVEYCVNVRGSDGKFTKDPLADYRHVSPDALPYKKGKKLSPEEQNKRCARYWAERFGS
jgi:hypothetical protein